MMNETSNELSQTENPASDQDSSLFEASEEELEVDPSTSEELIFDPGTSLQRPTPYLLHIQSGDPIELPNNQPALKLGKPNHENPPDLDLSGVPDAEIISRQHAMIHIEAEKYYIEDLGSSNGSYVNNAPVAKGERLEISSGDVIALGKDDKVTFIFRLP